ncbi:caspase activity and apoptosis inhibitor 1 isoform X2 [Echeneis naucrates]|uniref:caspase activity and apoptosis inhibitor 1 isoform X2 n=1 Tax=Echeneis naucrates TaxID=173247 RepID=UPI00111368CC|nr:caspase activity and apoptosis inhibitor 1 isoform X2 [Echeneis naucrates]
MLRKKSSTSEKKRKHSLSEERHDSNKRRSTETKTEDFKDELADPELDRIGSDIEEGGLDLSLPFQPITAYVKDKQEMLEQCFRVLGEKKLQKMLPDEIKDYSLEEIKKLCLEQLQPISEKHLFQILAGEDLSSGNGDESLKEMLESQQDNNVDSTSCLKEVAKTEDPKQGGGSSEESDVLSINADTYDSDIEGPKEEQTVKAVDRPVKTEDSNRELVNPAVNLDPAHPEPPTVSVEPVEAKKDIQSDIDRSVSEILALSTSSKKEAKEQSALPHSADTSLSVQDGPLSSHAPAASQPSIQQLELLELEMRARAIKALMKANDGKKPSVAKNI